MPLPGIALAFASAETAEKLLWFCLAQRLPTLARIQRTEPRKPVVDRWLTRGWLTGLGVAALDDGLRPIWIAPHTDRPPPRNGIGFRVSQKHGLGHPVLFQGYAIRRYLRQPPAIEIIANTQTQYLRLALGSDECKFLAAVYHNAQ